MALRAGRYGITKAQLEKLKNDMRSVSKKRGDSNGTSSRKIRSNPSHD